jgi:hypothetical protein
LKNGDDRSQGGSEALNFASLFQDKEEGKLKLVVVQLSPSETYYFALGEEIT